MIDLTSAGAGRRIASACVDAAIRARDGLQLTGAVIGGPLYLDYITVTGPLVLVTCELEDVRAVNGTFENVVKLDGSTLSSMDLVGSVFERVLLLEGVTVRGKASLWSTRMKSGLAASGLTVGGDFCGTEIHVAASVDLTKAVFTGKVTFERGHVGKSLFLNGATCKSSVSFDGARTAHIDARDATFGSGDATFKGGDVTLRGTRITGTLRLDRAHFEHAVIFEECRTRDLTAGGATFDGLVSFSSASVSAKMTIEDATFGAGLRIEGLQAGGWRMVRARFVAAAGIADAASIVAKNLDVSGDATFEQLDLAGDLTMTGGRFGGDLLFRDVSCRSLDLSGASVAGRLRFEELAGAVDVGPHDTMLDVFKLENVSVAQDVVLRPRVQGNVMLRGLSVQGWLDLRGLQVEGSGPPVAPQTQRQPASLRAQFLNVGRSVDINGTTRIDGELNLTGAKVNGALKLPASPLPPLVVLRSASLGALVFDGAAGLSETSRIDLVNCVYGGLEADHCWLMERQLVTQPHDIPNRQPFLALERNLRTSGRDVEADEVYFRGRRRTRWLMPWIQDVPQAVFSGYGVRPRRVAAWIGGVWACAFLFFYLTNGAVRDVTPHARQIGTTDKFRTVEAWTHVCAHDRASLTQAVFLPLQIFLPSSFADADTAVVQSCPVTLDRPPPFHVTFPAIVTVIAVFLLKLGGLTLIPLGIAIMTGLIRPAARA